MHVEQFKALLRPVTDFVSGRTVDAALTQALEHQFPGQGEAFSGIEAACHAAIAEGAMASQGSGGRRFGRVIEPAEDTGGLSVDVVDLTDMVGPHHRHPNGEICMVMPASEGARFDGVGRGWCVFAPGSEHRPTVTGGRAVVLYMLPGGEIDFTGE